MNAHPDYRSFLEAKVKLAASSGFEVDPSELNPLLKPHIAVAVRWMLAGGRRALFARFGMQKTTAHLETMRQVMRRQKGPTLITLPLGARLSFFHDAEQYFRDDCAVKLNFIQDDADIDAGAINLTNTESIREGKLDPRRFIATSYDEGDILRNMNTKTFWAFARDVKQVPIRFVATATPDPNDYSELLAYASYLDIMDVGQARTRFFKRNSEKADELTLHPHKEQEFWLWVVSWALFLQRPSDLGPEFSDEGYELPELDVRYHEIPSDHSTAAAERNGQGRLIKNAALGLKDAAAEKRDSLPARVAKMMDLRAEQPEAHRLVWHDLEAERHAIEKAAPEIVTVYGSQDLEKREQSLIDFAAGRIAELGGKPMMIGSGPNFQHHCWWSIFLGVGYKFKDVIQAVHRTQRYGQRFEGFKGENPRVRVDFIHTEAEREIVATFKEKWRRYDEQAARMAAIVREYGLAKTALGATLTRTMGTERREVVGDRFRLINNDCVEEARRLESCSVGLIVSSLPFSTQYEYTPTYNDFGHTDDDAHFFEQMDFLTPELLRALKPGRVAAIHCKDRIVEGARSGLGFQTVEPFADKVKAHFIKHGFAYIGTKYITTDVVRENAQTYRLGWTEQCKDGSRMGVGLVEYLHLFRKPQTDRSRGYADEPVVKSKDDYSIGRWQIDAGGFTRSSGNRLLTPAELASLPPKGIWARYREHSLTTVYDVEHHVVCNDALRAVGKLFPDFAITPVQSVHPDVWSDVTRMRTLNTIAAQKSREKHLCPLQFDIVERAIRQLSNPDDVVLDMFGGLMTVPYCAVKMRRRGLGIELSADYFRDGVTYCQEAEAARAVPGLFDLIEAEENSKSQAKEPEASGVLRTDAPHAVRVGEADAVQPATSEIMDVTGGESAAAHSNTCSGPLAVSPATKQSPAGLSDYRRDHNPRGYAAVNADQLGWGGNRPSSGADRDEGFGTAGGVTAGETAPIDLPVFLPATPTNRANDTVVGKHGGTSGAVPDAPPPSLKSAHGGASSSNDDGLDIPEFLRRTPKAAA